MADYYRQTCFSLDIPKPAANLIIALAYAHDHTCEAAPPMIDELQEFSAEEMQEIARISGALNWSRPDIMTALGKILDTIVENGGIVTADEPTGLDLLWHRGAQGAQRLYGEGRESPNLDLVVPIIREALGRYGVDGAFQILWSDTSNVYRPDSFTGGGVAFTKDAVHWFDATAAVAEMAKGLLQPTAQPAPGP